MFYAHGMVTEIKAAGEGDDDVAFTGIASTSDSDLADDIIEAGAFGNIDAKRVALLRDHNPTAVIGGWNSFEQDGKNLKVAGTLAIGVTDLARETYALMKRGFLSGISVGYKIDKGGVKYDEGTGIRHITKAKLVEASIVAVPANPRARVRSVKSLIEKSPALAREWLIENGFDDADAEVIMRKGMHALIDREAARSRLQIMDIDGFAAGKNETSQRLAQACAEYGDLLKEIGHVGHR